MPAIPKRYYLTVYLSICEAPVMKWLGIISDTKTEIDVENNRVEQLNSLMIKTGDNTFFLC
jgi:hypothetical protein